MWYWMEGFPAEAYVRTVPAGQPLGVDLQELNLPPAARLELQRFLRWNQQPEHRFYHYDYYRDNCSTRVRDALDRVLGGAIRAQTDAIPAGHDLPLSHPASHRQRSADLHRAAARAGRRGSTARSPHGRRCSCRWRCGSTCAASRSPGADGRPAPLVLSERTLFESTAAPPPPVPPRWLARYLFLGVILGCAAAWLGGVARRESAGRVAFGLVAGGWELLAGLGGVVLAGLWSLHRSRHGVPQRESLPDQSARRWRWRWCFRSRSGRSRAGRVAEALALVGGGALAARAGAQGAAGLRPGQRAGDRAGAAGPPRRRRRATAEPLARPGCGRGRRERPRTAGTAGEGAAGSSRPRRRHRRGSRAAVLGRRR